MLNGPEPKFQLKQEVSSCNVPGSVGKHTGYVKRICMHEDGTITYMTTFHPGWLDESRLQGAPDTVMIEIPRDVADYCANYVDGPWARNAVTIACKKALGQ